MVKASLLLMLLLTVLVAMTLRWRDTRMANPEPPPPPRGRKPTPKPLLARAKLGLDRWVTAAAIAAILTIALMGGLHWIRVWIG